MSSSLLDDLSDVSVYDDTLDELMSDEENEQQAAMQQKQRNELSPVAPAHTHSAVQFASPLTQIHTIDPFTPSAYILSPSPLKHATASAAASEPHVDDSDEELDRNVGALSMQPSSERKEQVIDARKGSNSGQNVIVQPRPIQSAPAPQPQSQSQSQSQHQYHPTSTSRTSSNEPLPPPAWMRADFSLNTPAAVREPPPSTQMPSNNKQRSTAAYIDPRDYAPYQFDPRMYYPPPPGMMPYGPPYGSPYPYPAAPMPLPSRAAAASDPRYHHPQHWDAMQFYRQPPPTAAYPQFMPPEFYPPQSNVNPTPSPAQPHRTPLYYPTRPTFELEEAELDAQIAAAQLSLMEDEDTLKRLQKRAVTRASASSAAASTQSTHTQPSFKGTPLARRNRPSQFSGRNPSPSPSSSSTATSASSRSRSRQTSPAPSPAPRRNGADVFSTPLHPSSKTHSRSNSVDPSPQQFASFASTSQIKNLTTPTASSALKSRNPTPASASAALNTSIQSTSSLVSSSSTSSLTSGRTHSRGGQTDRNRDQQHQHHHHATQTPAKKSSVGSGFGSSARTGRSGASITPRPHSTSGRSNSVSRDRASAAAADPTRESFERIRFQERMPSAISMAAASSTSTATNVLNGFDPNLASFTASSLMTLAAAAAAAASSFDDADSESTSSTVFSPKKRMRLFEENEFTISAALPSPMPAASVDSSHSDRIFVKVAKKPSRSIEPKSDQQIPPVNHIPNPFITAAAAPNTILTQSNSGVAALTHSHPSSLTSSSNSNSTTSSLHSSSTQSEVARFTIQGGHQVLESDQAQEYTTTPHIQTTHMPHSHSRSSSHNSQQLARHFRKPSRENSPLTLIPNKSSTLSSSSSSSSLSSSAKQLPVASPMKQRTAEKIAREMIDKQVAKVKKDKLEKQVAATSAANVTNVNGTNMEQAAAASTEPIDVRNLSLIASPIASLKSHSLSNGSARLNENLNGNEASQVMQSSSTVAAAAAPSSTTKPVSHPESLPISTRISLIPSPSSEQDEPLIVLQCQTKPKKSVLKKSKSLVVPDNSLAIPINHSDELDSPELKSKSSTPSGMPTEIAHIPSLDSAYISTTVDMVRTLYLYYAHPIDEGQQNGMNHASSNGKSKSHIRYEMNRTDFFCFVVECDLLHLIPHIARLVTDSSDDDNLDETVLQQLPSSDKLLNHKVSPPLFQHLWAAYSVSAPSVAQGGPQRIFSFESFSDFLAHIALLLNPEPRSVAASSTTSSSSNVNGSSDHDSVTQAAESMIFLLEHSILPNSSLYNPRTQLSFRKGLSSSVDSSSSHSRLKFSPSIALFFLFHMADLIHIYGMYFADTAAENEVVHRLSGSADQFKQHWGIFLQIGARIHEGLDESEIREPLFAPLADHAASASSCSLLYSEFLHLASFKTLLDSSSNRLIPCTQVSLALFCEILWAAVEKNIFTHGGSVNGGGNRKEKMAKASILLQNIFQILLR